MAEDDSDPDMYMKLNLHGKSRSGWIDWAWEQRQLIVSFIKGMVGRTNKGMTQVVQDVAVSLDRGTVITWSTYITSLSCIG